MKPGPHTHQLQQTIEGYNLAARNPDLAWIQLCAEQGIIGDDVARDLLQSIEPRVQEAIDHPNYLHRPPEADELYPSDPPDIELGKLVDNPDVRFGLRFRDRPRSVLVTGNAGSGKTTAILNIITKAFELGQQDPSQHVSQIIPDKKLDYTHLPDVLGPKWTRLSVHDSGTHLGLNAPEGVPPGPWINLVATIFSARAGMIAAWTCFANMIRWLVSVMNPEQGSSLRWPSLKLLLEVATTAPLSLFSAKPEYMGSLIQVLEHATQAMHTFDCFGGLDLERDIIRPRKHLVLEMPNVAPAWIRQFILDLVFAQILYGRIHRHHKVDRAELLICMDEADQDATAEADRSYPDKMSPLAMTLRQGREYGIMTVVGLGRLNHASAYCLTEPQYHLVFNQSDAASVLAARHTLVLPPEADMMFPALQPGECIAREAQGPWPHPMLVKIDYLPPGRGPMTRAYDSHPFSPAKDLADLPEVLSALDELVTSKRKKQLKQRRAEPADLPKNAHALLHAAAAHRWFPVARLWEKTDKRPSPEAQISAQRALEQRELAKFEEVRVGRVNVLLISVAEKGYQFLGRAFPSHQGRGGIAHQHIAAWIADVGRRRSHDTAIEWIIPGTNHPADVAWKVQDDWHAFECVVTCDGNLTSHINACFVESQVIATLTIVLLQKAIRDRVQRDLRSNPMVMPHMDRIRFEVVETYMKELWP